MACSFARQPKVRPGWQESTSCRKTYPGELEGVGPKAKPLATKKRTIGQVDYEEKIFKTEILENTKNTLPEGYRWVLWTELDALTLSGPHRKWIKELSGNPA